MCDFCYDLLSTGDMAKPIRSDSYIQPLESSLTDVSHDDDNSD
jgi:hypothetical protein